MGNIFNCQYVTKQPTHSELQRIYCYIITQTKQTLWMSKLSSLSRWICLIIKNIFWIFSGYNYLLNGVHGIPSRRSLEASTETVPVSHEESCVGDMGKSIDTEKPVCLLLYKIKFLNSVTSSLEMKPRMFFILVGSSLEIASDTAV